MQSFRLALLLLALPFLWMSSSQAQGVSINADVAIVELDSTPGIMVDEQFEIQVRFSDGSGQSVFSGFTTVSFDSSKLRVDAIQHSTAYPFLQLGTLGTGSVVDVGAVASSLVPTSDTLTVTLLATALSDDPTLISLGPATGQLAETTVYGVDGDQRSQMQYGNAVINAVSGDCNLDTVVDAGDLAALQVVIAGAGSAATPCDANADSSVDNSDLACVRLRIFDLSASCAP